jgi:hypothetical protein
MDPDIVLTAASSGSGRDNADTEAVPLEKTADDGHRETESEADAPEKERQKIIRVDQM